MAKPFKILRGRMSPLARQKAQERTKYLLEDMRLQELREARHMTQARVAKLLKIQQASISKLERRADMYISTLRDYLVAIGGELEITARFPDSAIRIKQFEDLA